MEAMLSSQTGCVTVVLMSSFYGLISGAVQVIVLLGTGVVAFGVNFGRMNVPATQLCLSSFRHNLRGLRRSLGCRGSVAQEGTRLPGWSAASPPSWAEPISRLM
jgi:hypothetical protein